MDQVQLLLQMAVDKYPLLTMLMFLMSALRMVFKPLFSVYAEYVKNTPSTEDDATLVKVEQSKAYKAILWILDFTASVKIPPKQ